MKKPYPFGLPIQMYKQPTNPSQDVVGKMIDELMVKQPFPGFSTIDKMIEELKVRVRVLIPIKAFHQDRIDLVKRTFEVHDKIYGGVRRRTLRMSRGQQMFHEIILENKSKIHHVSGRLTDSCTLTESVFNDMATYVIEESDPPGHAIKNSIDKHRENVTMADPFFNGVVFAEGKM